MNNSPAVAFMKDCQGRYVYINETLERDFNVKFADLHLKTDFDWLPQDIAKQLHENDCYVLSTGKNLQVIETIPDFNGCLHYWLCSKFLFTDSREQQLVGGVAIDITEQNFLNNSYLKKKN
ncbi:MAG: PAS domain-containing protein [Richelia sp. SM1_7_0]|nr:PAS domain-containing protein [Richelia sp. SM1_7_0]